MMKKETAAWVTGCCCLTISHLSERKLLCPCRQVSWKQLSFLHSAHFLFFFLTKTMLPKQAAESWRMYKACPAIYCVYSVYPTPSQPHNFVLWQPQAETENFPNQNDNIHKANNQGPTHDFCGGGGGTASLNWQANKKSSLSAGGTTITKT